MDHASILKRVDHTLLTPTATWDQIKTLCDEGVRFETASVCIPPRYIKRANDYVGKNLKLTTVIGFPNGYCTPEVKVFETEDAIRDGADEIDMVINLGLAKAGDWEGVLQEIKAVKASCKGRILKVIVEACLLTQEEKVAVCRVVSMSGADYIKTSTGFSTGGATVEDVKLFRERISPDVRIKAAGGIRTFEQAQALIEAGADRIGASALVASATQEANKRKRPPAPAVRRGFQLGESASQGLCPWTPPAFLQKSWAKNFGAKLRFAYGKVNCRCAALTKPQPSEAGVVWRGGAAE